MDHIFVSYRLKKPKTSYIQDTLNMNDIFILTAESEITLSFSTVDDEIDHVVFGFTPNISIIRSSPK